MNELASGPTVGRYQILGLIGRGGMGEVYAAYHPDLDRRIALKIVRGSGPEAAKQNARLLPEARAVARLSHPNVVTVHDAGTDGDRAYIAMEFIQGRTLDRWLEAERPSWRQALAVLIAAGRGLAAAHEAGVVHGDFKPANVMVGNDGSVRVMDFGLARILEAGAPPAAPEAAPAAHDSQSKQTSVQGTPAYMAPEQFRGEAASALGDQFSFCVALYEALYGARPFKGEHLLSLSWSVAEGELRPIPGDRRVPAWVRRPLMRGLSAMARDRFPSMGALIEVLQDDPAVKNRRRLAAAGAIALAVVATLAVRQTVKARHGTTEREIAAHFAAGERAVAAARTNVATARDLRTRAFAAFDALDAKQGELLWRDVIALLPRIDAGYDEAGQAIAPVFLLDPSRRQTRERLADIRHEHLAFADEFRIGSKAEILRERLASADTGGKRAQPLDAPGAMELRTSPAATTVVLERFDRAKMTGRRDATIIGRFGGAASTSLPAGSYRLSLDGPGLATIQYPFTVEGGQRVVIDLRLPPSADVPRGFVYVPPGELWFGDSDELLRSQFLSTVPIHRRATRAYLIAARETTYGEWIEFLRSLPPAERARYAPNVTSTKRGYLQLRETSAGWELLFQLTTQRYLARSGEPFRYSGRSQRSTQDWLRFPVTGISQIEIDRYLAWLVATRRVPAARPCTELEWERAARGADDRLYPHGDVLDRADANFDLTYDRTDGAYGPDEVGTHPLSQSPFGIDDMAGNVFELVVSSQRANELVMRGGSAFISAISARITNREPVTREFRDVSTGFRVCADPPAP
jgi:formylglycine-generating enzyme required for sulfatase activity/predicted Ser/Thr protein kinase